MLKTIMDRAENIKFAGLIFLFACIFFVNLGGWDLKNPDEPRYAQIAREMMETGQYILPHLNGESYPDKPPLFFWMIALVSKPFSDVTAFSARFPAALAGLGMIVLTCLFARKLYNPFTGFLAALILFTSEGFFMTSISVHFDTILSFWTTLALFLFYCGYTCSDGRKYFLSAYVCIGLAVLTKGPIGILIPLLTMFLFLLTGKQLPRLKEMCIGRGILIVVGIVAVWLVPACIIGGEEYTGNILFKQTFGRAVNSYSHRSPFYYYLYKFPLHFLPWSLFIPSAAIYFWRNRGAKLNIQLPLIWFAGIFTFLSLVSCKRGLYLVPIYPAAAILIAKFWDDNISVDLSGAKAIQLKLFKTPLLLFLAVFLILFAASIGIAVFAAKFSFLNTRMFSSSVLYPVAWFLGLSCIAGIIIYMTMQKRIKYFLCFIATDMVILSVMVVLVIFPFFNSFKSAKQFCGRIEKIVSRDDTLIALFEPELFNYFLHRYPIPKVKDTEKLEALLTSGEKVYFLLEEKHYKEASKKHKQMINILDMDKIGHTLYYLASGKTD